MNSPDAQLVRFVRALHRRQVAVRVVERAGVGLLCGCVAALVLVPILLWRGQDAWGVAGVALSLGTLAGAAWSVARRPDALAAAAEADRQLGTADLLGSAWTVWAAASGETARLDPWQQSVLAMAAARFDTVTPSAVLLRRFGGRAWGCIALAVALVATLASFSTESLRASAGGRQFADARGNALGRKDRPLSDMGAQGSRTQRRVEQNPGDERDRGKTAIPADSGEHPTPETAINENGEDPSGDSRQTAASGVGEGSGRTEPDGRDPSRPDAAQEPVEPTERSQGGKRTSGGSGPAAREASADDTGAAGGTLSDGDAERATPPPWQQESWDAAVEAAGEAVRAGRVSDQYRDLVRGYFDRPAAVAPAPPSGPAR